MINLSDIPEEVRLARGDYTTVRAAHEDEKQRLSILCGKMQSIISGILKAMQPKDGADTHSAEDLLKDAQFLLNSIGDCTIYIESLASQRAELKQKAWRNQ